MVPDFKKITRVFEGETRSLFFWTAVLYGLGIGVYFSLSREPPLWPFLVGGALGLLVLGFFRNNQILTFGFRGGLIIVAGLAVATLKTKVTDTQTFAREVGPVAVEGSVERVEDLLEDGLRLTLKNVRFGEKLDAPPDKIRFTVRTDYPALRPGMVIKTRAILLPLPEPVMPGGYDFGRQLWFEGIGAVGFAVADITVEANPETTWAEKVEGLRQSLFERITAAAPGPGGAVSAALITGIRDDIPDEVSENMRIAGLAHLLAISGLHMALVTGFLFIALKSLLALFPKFALKYPVRKFAAVGAFLGAMGYLVISGASLSTQRAFIMVAIVLLAVVVDRRAISMRLVAIAAIVVLTLSPEALLHPSFQMSFAAVTGLVAGYGWLRPKFLALREAHPGPMGKVRLYVLGVIISTLIAEVTIGPIALYHFGRFALYGLPANLLAVPIMGFLVMPLGLLGLVLTPFGLDGFIWPLMAFSMQIILDIAASIATWPNADFMIPEIPLISLLFLVLAGLWLCLWQNPILKRGFVVPLAVGLGLYFAHELPDALIDRDGRLFALRSPEGTYYFSSLRVSSFSRENWQRAFGQKEAYNFREAGDWLKCDPLGCLADAGKWKLAVTFEAQGFAEDCQRADIILTNHYAPFSCKDEKIVVDRAALYRNGAHALWLDEKIKIRSVGEERGERPWTTSPQ